MENQAIFNDINDCLLNDIIPSKRINEFAKQKKFDNFPFSLLIEQKNTKQSPVYHPEGSVWNHTMLVVDRAAKLKQYSSDSRTFMWAALLHDIGKPATTKIHRGKITAYNHDKAGADLARRFLTALTDKTDFVTRVVWLVRYHMQILYVVKNLPFQDIAGMSKNTDIVDVALLSYCDRLGRTGADKDTERENVLLFLEKCNERKDALWLKQE